MRTDIDAAVVSAITTGSAYLLWEKITVEPTRLYFTAFSNSNPPPSPDAAGLLDTPVPQTVGITSDANRKVVTWYNDGGYLKYQVEGSSTLTSTGLGICGRPGAIPTGLGISWVDLSGNLIVATASGSALEAHSASPWSSGPTDTGLDFLYSYIACHMLDASTVAVLHEASGGFRAAVCINSGSWSASVQDNRFMFPISVQTSGSGRDYQGLIDYSGAVKDEDTGNVFIYISNHITGGIEGIEYHSASGVISDVFTAVPTDLKASICEFRISNMFSLGSHKFMAGSFLRHENVESPLVETMILRSEDGHSWAMDRFSLVSDLGYHLYAAYDLSGSYALKLCNCNRIASQPVTWLYDYDALDGGISHNYVTINHRSIISLSDDQVAQLDLDLGAADESYMFDSHIEVGAKLTLDLIYGTTSGSVGTAYGTYFIDSISCGVRDGARQLQLSCINMSLWQLRSMSSPFYVEIISKASARDNLDDEDSAMLYTAEFAGVWEDKFSVDFWEIGEPWDDTPLGITGLNIHKKGGVDRTTGEGNHKCGVRTKDLKDNISCEEYPAFTSTTATFEIYGWSYASAGSDNDEVQLHLWLESTSGSLYEDTIGGSHWPCTYVGTAAGDYPIVYNVTQPVGTKVRELGLIFINSSETKIYPCRIDCTSGTATYYGTPTGSAGWYSAEDKRYKVRRKCYPHIMFSRQPYDTFNFTQAASFTDSVAGYVATLGPVGYGLVGLAQDGRNYILARWDKVSADLQIVKVRNGSETLLASGSTVFDMSAAKMMFIHRDGHFEIRLQNASAEWVKQLEYDWQYADGWMFTSEVMAKHCGIWGEINVPNFRITGFDEGGDQDVDLALGIPLLPGYETLSYFPSSGTVDIGDNLYSYSGIIQPPTDGIRGPFQYRQHGEYNGRWGMHIRDMDWNGGPSVTGKLIGVDDGFVYQCTGVNWTPYQTTSGVREYLPGRALYYCQSKILKKAYHTLSNRVYITGGLNTGELVRGANVYQPWGESCYLHTTGEIECLFYYGSSGDVDVTIEDLISHLAQVAGATVQFPGDITIASHRLNNSDMYEVASVQLSEGFDVRFKMTTPAVGGAVDLYANVVLADIPADTNLRVRVARVNSSTLTFSLISGPSGTVIDAIEVEVSPTNPSLRVLYHKQFVTIYVNGIWAVTFHTNGITYPDEMTFTFGGASSPYVDLSDILFQEIPDWREAIYIDLETTGESAIQSVIQERPVEVYPRWDGSIAYWYDPVRSTITQAIYPREHQWHNRIPPDAASDAIVYYSDVLTLLNNDYRDSFGFSTKVYRFPNLEAGAKRAALISLSRAYSERKRHTVTIRPDLRIEPGDKLSVAYTATGTGRAISFTMVVDGMRLMHEPKNSQMVIDGREVS